MARDEFTNAPTEKSKMSSEAPVTHVQAQDPVDTYDVDYEKHGAQREANPLPELKRKLKSRHLQMIAIGE
jgi:amino acid transporter